MPRATLVIVPDEGAAEMVRGALVEAGIQPEFTRARPEHPYRPSVLAEPWCVLVPEDRLADGRNALARLEHDLAEEADAQARAWEGRPDPEEAEVASARFSARDVDALPAAHVPRVLWALALAFVLPFPAVAFYARARRLGAVFLGLFLASVGLALTQGIWTLGLDGLVLLDDASEERLGQEGEGDQGNHVPSDDVDAETVPRPTVAPGEVILEGIDVAGPQEPPDQGDEVAPLALVAPLATVDWIVLLGLATKIADLLAGLVVLGLDRRRASA